MPGDLESPWVQDGTAAAKLAYSQNNNSSVKDDVKLDVKWIPYRVIDSAKGLRVKIWIDPANARTLVSFRGTSSVAELKIDTDLGVTEFFNADGAVVGKVHKGFGTAFLDISGRLSDELDRLKSMSFLGASKGGLQFSGHSLGGAMADLASTYFADKYKDVNVTSTQIATPTVGDTNYKGFAETQPNIERLRIVAPGDPVANLKLPGLEYTSSDVVVVGKTNKERHKAFFRQFLAIATLPLGGPAVAASIAQKALDMIDAHSIDTYEDQISDEVDPDMLTEDVDPLSNPRDSAVPVDSSQCLCDCHRCDQVRQEYFDAGEDPNMFKLEPPLYKNPYYPSTTSTTLTSTAPVKDLQANNPKAQAQTLTQRDFQKKINDMLQEETKQIEEQFSTVPTADSTTDPKFQTDRDKFESQLDNEDYQYRRANYELQYPDKVTDEEAKTVLKKMKAFLDEAKRDIYSSDVNTVRALASSFPEFGDFINAGIGAIGDTANNFFKKNAEKYSDRSDNTNGYNIMDIREFGGVNFTDPNKLRMVLGAWLMTSNATPANVFETIQKQVLNDYIKLRSSDLDTKQANSVKEVNYNREQELQSKKDAKYNELKKKQEYLNKLSESESLRQLVATGKLSLDEVYSNYAAGMTDQVDTLMQAPEQWKQGVGAMQEKLKKEREYDLANIGDDQKERVGAVYDIMQANPFMQKDQAMTIYDSYKADPNLMAQQIQKARDEHTQQLAGTLGQDYMDVMEVLDTSQFEGIAPSIAQNLKDLVSSGVKNIEPETAKTLLRNMKAQLIPSMVTNPDLRKLYNTSPDIKSRLNELLSNSDPKNISDPLFQRTLYDMVKPDPEKPTQLKNPSMDKFLEASQASAKERMINSYVNGPSGVAPSNSFSAAAAVIADSERQAEFPPEPVAPGPNATRDEIVVYAQQHQEWQSIKDEIQRRWNLKQQDIAGKLAAAGIDVVVEQAGGLGLAVNWVSEKVSGKSVGQLIEEACTIM